MEDLVNVGFYINIVGAAQGVFLAVILFNSRNHQAANRILGALLLVISYLLVWTVIHDSRQLVQYPNVWGTGPALSLAIVPLLFLYVKAMTSADFVWKKTYYFHFVPVLLFLLNDIPFYLQDKATQQDLIIAHYKTSPGSFVFFLMLNIYLILYMVCIFRMLVHYEESIKNYYADTERIRLNWMRNLLVVVGSVWLGYVIASGVAGLHIASTWLCFILSLFVYYVAYMSIRQPAIMATWTNDVAIPATEQTDEPEDDPLSTQPAVAVVPTKYAKSGLTHHEIDHYVQKLTSVMEEEKIYRNNGLTLKELADRLAMSTHHLSQLLNQSLQENFYDFVNRYRIEEVKQGLLNPKKQHLTILAIALEAGFTSKAAFNAAFKKHTGYTPTQYKRLSNR
jgi:AraC-like DNA-binding protein